MPLEGHPIGEVPLFAHFPGMETEAQVGFRGVPRKNRGLKMAGLSK